MNEDPALKTLRRSRPNTLNVKVNRIEHIPTGLGR